MDKKFVRKRYWFPAKEYGYGWGLPVTWQGWLVIVAYLVLIAAGIFLFPLHNKAGVQQYIIFLYCPFDRTGCILLVEGRTCKMAMGKGKSLGIM